MARPLLRMLGGPKRNCATRHWQPATRLGVRGSEGLAVCDGCAQRCVMFGGVARVLLSIVAAVSASRGAVVREAPGVDSCVQVHLRVFALSHSPVAHFPREQ